MKKALSVVCIVVCAALALGIALQTCAVKLMRHQLARCFPGAEVSLSGTVRLRYSLFLWREPLLAKAVLKDALCEIKAPGRALTKITPPLMGSSHLGYLPVGSIVLDNCRIIMHTADARCDAVISGAYNVYRKRLERVDLSLASLVYGPLQLEGVEAVFDRDQPSRLSVRRAVFDKLQVSAVSAGTGMRGDMLVLSQGSASALGGTIGFNAALPTQSPWRYQVDLQLKNMDVAVLVDDFKWQEKVRASGLLSGAVSVASRLGAVGRINGRLQVDVSGGEVNIIDRAFLENIARWSKQPVELITDSFRDYRYRSGSLTIDSQGQGLVLDVVLSGPQGKRDLTVVLHR